MMFFFFDNAVISVIIFVVIYFYIITSVMLPVFTEIDYHKTFLKFLIPISAVMTYLYEKYLEKHKENPF